MKLKAHQAVALSMAAAAVVVLSTSRPSTATEPVANIGTLTCVASPGDKETLGPERRVSCTFEPLTGPKANLGGTIKRVGAKTPSDAKIILAWSVMGPQVGATVKQLEGRYVGAVGEGRGANASGLVGGHGGHITLQPLTLDPNIGKNAALAVLELHLAAIKA
ncbi:MAG: DUF992 domain-containing protein [Hyphomicrobiaceae bacterium]